MELMELEKRTIESSSEERSTSARVSEVRACCASIREAVSESHGREAVSKPWWPVDQVARLDSATQEMAKKSSTLAVKKPRLKRRRVWRHSHHWATARKKSAAKRPESGTHCGEVSFCCCWFTLAVVSWNSSEAAGRIRSRISAEALDI